MTTSGIEPAESLSAGDITAIDPQFDAVYVNFTCAACGGANRLPQPMVGGAPVGSLDCSTCTNRHRIAEDAFFDAAEAHWPEKSLLDITQVLEEASRVTHRWPAHPELAELLSYEGISLGELCQHASFSIVASCLLEYQKGC